MEEAATSALKMTTHNDSDGKVEGYRERWSKVHEITKEWVARMTTLVECWNKLDGNVGELSSWVNKQVTTIININTELKDRFYYVMTCRTPRLWKERQICPLRNWSPN